MSTLDPKSLPNETRNSLFEYALRLGDDSLVLGHRLSEWCGHGPILEEDIAMANIALDCIGRANVLLGVAGEIEGKSRSADDLAFHRDEWQFRNVLLVEQPNGDFAHTMMRQFFFDAYALGLFRAAAGGPHDDLAGIAKKSSKESTYHLRHSSQWILRLGDGTEESHTRAQAAADALWKFTPELFESDATHDVVRELGIAPDPAVLRNEWRETVIPVLEQATLRVPEEDENLVTGGRQGRHSEHLGHMLAEMQILPRSHPGATW